MLSVSRPHWICPHLWHVCFPSLRCVGSRLLCWELSEVGPDLYALPRSKPLMFRFSGTPQRCRLSWVYVLCSSQVRAAQATRCLASALSPGGVVSLITSLVQLLSFPGVHWGRRLRCAVRLWGADLWLGSPWWISTIQDPRKTWLATGSLLTVWESMPSWGQVCPLGFWL